MAGAALLSLTSAAVPLVILALVGLSALAGFLGALLGLGGGLFLVPILILVFGVDPVVAVAASTVGVIATSLGSAATYVEAGLTDVRVGMFLESATAVGGLAGALLTVAVLARAENLLVLAFVPVVLAAAVLMVRRRREEVDPAPPPSPLADRLKLHGVFHDPRTGATTSYRVSRVGSGLGFAFAAGVASGLLGIGGGIFNVPALSTVMNVPLRVAAPTSNFMIGVTAAAGALIYLFAGTVNLALTAPIVLGVFAGSFAGTRVLASVPTVRLRQMFVVVLALAAVLMGLRGVGLLG